MGSTSWHRAPVAGFWVWGNPGLRLTLPERAFSWEHVWGLASLLPPLLAWPKELLLQRKSELISHFCCTQPPARISLSHVSPSFWLKTFNLLDTQNTALAHHIYESLETGHWLQKQFLEPTAAAHEEVSSPFQGKTAEPESHCNHEPLHLSLPQQREHFLQSVTSEALMEMSFKFWKKLI